MEKLSDTYKEQGIDFTFPIKIKDNNGKQTYYENSSGYWWKAEYNTKGYETYYEDSNDYWSKSEYDANGNKTYYETSNDYWCRYERDDNGKVTYYEDSTGYKRGIPKSSKTCEGKVVEVDGIKYKLKAL